MSSIKALKKKISKRAKQKKNIQVKNSIRLKQAKQAAEANLSTEPTADAVADASKAEQTSTTQS